MKRTLLLLVFLLYAFLTIPNLHDDRRLLPDEAFFLTFARHAAVGGDWWLQGSLDKPPLTIYANAVMIALVGADTLPNGVLTLDIYKGEFVGRLLAFFSGIVMIAVTMRLALDLSKKILVAMMGGAVLATLPMIHLYSASAFMDMPMVALAMTSLLMATRKRAFASGMLLALAFAAKPQAVYFAPLVVWYVWQRGTMKHVVRFSVALAVGVGVLFLWDVLRPGDSVFALGAANNDFFAPTLNIEVLAYRLGEWMPRAYGDWMRFSVFMLVVLGMMVAGLFHRPVRVLSVWTIAYFAGHVILFDTLYERYLLLIVPMLTLAVVCPLVAWQTTVFMPKRKHMPSLQRHWRQFASVGLTIMGIVCCLRVGLLESSRMERDRLLTVSMLDDYADFSWEPDRAANWLNDLPTATVIYDHWTGWTLRYYMGEWQDKRIVYYPSPQEMVAGIQALDEEGTRYFVAPTSNFAAYGLSSPYSESLEVWLSAFEAAGLDVRLEKELGEFVVYTIERG
jgi:hypothetical protein